MKEFENIQFTLTFKQDVNKKEADKELARWLKPLMDIINDRDIELEIYSEIGKNLKYHYHGYFCWSNDHPEIGELCKIMLHKWKHGNGFVGLSYGSIDTWIEYISKAVGPKYLMHHSEETINEWINEKLDIIKLEDLNTIGDWLDYIKLQTIHEESKELPTVAQAETEGSSLNKK